MNNFDLVVIGACHGFWLENEVKKCSDKILLIEPKGVVNTGDVISKMTVNEEKWI